VNDTQRPTTDPLRNQLLSALPTAEWHRWRPLLRPVDLALGEVLCESGSTPAFVYFPTTAIVSLLYLTEEGAATEVAVVGHDGLVGISAFMGGNATASRSVVHSAGQAYALPSHVVKSEAERVGPARLMLLRFALSMFAQVAQTALCNRHHSIDQQLCRRLLQGLDRSPANGLTMTQELTASLLGVRREGVTAAALRLQKAGVIRYRRGHIDVLDRRALESRTCECYSMVATECLRLLPTPMAA